MVTNKHQSIMLARECVHYELLPIKRLATPRLVFMVFDHYPFKISPIELFFKVLLQAV
jgi:hypothetical protein